MSSRQHAPLILTSPDGSSHKLAPVPFQRAWAGGGYDEAWIRDLFLAHADAVSLQEIDPSFGPLVPVRKELDTRGAGFADALYVDPLGMPTLVECKLWRNPEARREAVGQILGHARARRAWAILLGPAWAVTARGSLATPRRQHRGARHPVVAVRPTARPIARRRHDGVPDRTAATPGSMRASAAIGGECDGEPDPRSSRRGGAMAAGGRGWSRRRGARRAPSPGPPKPSRSASERRRPPWSEREQVGTSPA